MRELQVAPVGVTGEFYIGGEGLARGYLQAAGADGGAVCAGRLSGEAGARLYRTGDLVKVSRRTGIWSLSGAATSR